MLHNEFLDLKFYIMFFPIVFFYGICIGSFLNVVIFRLPKNESLIKRASHCMTCGAKIKIIDIIPIFSWVFILHGRCRNCGEKISSRYPIVEALNGIVYVVTFAVMDFSLETIMYCFFFSALIAIAFMDWDTMEIDPRLLIFLACMAIPGMIISVLSEEQVMHLPEFMRTSSVSIWSHLIGLVCVSVPFFLIGEISKPIIERIFGERFRAIELGDTLLMAAGGLMLGWKATLAATFFGIIVGALVGFIYKRVKGESKIPFGPFLAIGLFLGALFGEQLIDWYVTLLTYDPTLDIQ